MAGLIQSFESQKSVNVSQEARSSPRTVANSPTREKVITRTQTADTTEVLLVKDSVEDYYKAAGAGPSQLQDALLAVEDEDDLYNLSPRTEVRTRALRSAASGKHKCDAVLTPDNTITHHEQAHDASVVVAPTVIHLTYKSLQDQHAERPIAFFKTLSHHEDLAPALLLDKKRSSRDEAILGAAQGDGTSSTKRTVCSSATSENPRHESQTSIMASASKTPLAPALSCHQGGTSAKERLKAKRASRIGLQSQPSKPMDEPSPAAITKPQLRRTDLIVPQQASVKESGKLDEASIQEDTTSVIIGPDHVPSRDNRVSSGKLPKLKHSMRGGTQEDLRPQWKLSKAVGKAESGQEHEETNEEESLSKVAQRSKERRLPAPRKQIAAPLPHADEDADGKQNALASELKAQPEPALLDEEVPDQQTMKPSQQKASTRPSKPRPAKPSRLTRSAQLNNVQSESDYEVSLSSTRLRQTKKTKTVQHTKAPAKMARSGDPARPSRETRSKAVNSHKPNPQPKQTHVIEPLLAAAAQKSPGDQAEEEMQVMNNEGEGPTEDHKSLTRVIPAEPEGGQRHAVKSRDIVGGNCLIKDGLKNGDDEDEDHVSPKAWRQAGATQENPVELSDNDKSSSLTEPSSPSGPTIEELLRPMDQKGKNSTGEIELHTPAHVASSPPKAGQCQPLKSVPRMVNSNKPAFISWDKSGPRNQGSILVNPQERSSSRAKCSLKTPANATLDANGREKTKRPSSDATSIHNVRPDNKLQRSNVAGRVDDALDSFLTDRPPKPGFKISSGLSKPATGSLMIVQDDKPEDAAGVIAETNDFGYNNAYDFDGDTLVHDATDGQDMDVDVQSKLTNTATDSQQAMPPPQKVSKTQQKEAPKTLTLPKVVESAHGDDNVKNKPSPRIETSAISGPGTNPVSRHEQAATAAQFQVTEFAAVSSPAASKRVKRSGDAQSRDAEPSKRVKQNVARICDGYKHQFLHFPSKATAGITSLAKASNSKMDKVHLKRGRYTSHGSQTVDMNGSPIPANVDVTGTNTVLDVYSQRAALVSDQDTSKQVRRQLEWIPDLDEDDESDAQGYAYDVSPPQQTGALSRNVKLLPSSPRTDTRGITTVKVTEHESAKLLQKDKQLATLHDPFNISDASSQDQIDLTKNVLLHVPHVFGRRHQTNDQSNTTQRARSAANNESRCGVATSAPRVYQGVSKSTRDLTRHIGGLKDQFPDPRTLKQDLDDDSYEDGEKTLVNEETYIASNIPDEEVCEESPAKNVAKPGLEIRCDFSEPLTDDLMDWTKEKKPHQLDLMEQLHKVVRRIVEYVSEQEQTFQRVLEDRSKRDLYMIEQEDLLRAKKYDKLVEELRGLKRSKRQDLKRLVTQIDAKLEEYTTLKENRQETIARWAASNRKLEDLVANIS